MAGVSEADRQRVIEALEGRAALGQLSEPELDNRIQRARAALTHAGLDGILMDLPPAPDPPAAPTSIARPAPITDNAPEPTIEPWTTPGQAAAPATDPAPTEDAGPAWQSGPWSVPTAAPTPNASGEPAWASGPWAVPWAVPPAPAPLGEHGPWRLPPEKPARVVRDRRPWWRRPTTYGGAGLVAVAAAAMWAIAGATSFTPENEPTVSPATVPETAPRRTPPPPTDRVTPEPTSTLPPPPPPPPTMPSWEPVVLRVGTDIQPGRYVNTAEINCYWERVHGFGGTLDDVIVNGNGGHVVVDVLASDAGLRARGCGDWRPYSPPSSPATSFGDGDWLVGGDVAAGTYRVTAPGIDASCYWERGRGFTHDYGEVIESGFEVPEAVDLSAGERFTAFACGTWTRV